MQSSLKSGYFCFIFGQFLMTNDQNYQIYQNPMDEELKRSLLKKVGFDKYYEQAMLRVVMITQKNDSFQKHGGSDAPQEIKQQIRSQSKFIEKEILQLKDLLTKLDSFKDPESKNKIKKLRVDAQKQIQRNKVIFKDVITQFVKKSVDKSNASAYSDDIGREKNNHHHFNGKAKRPKNDAGRVAAEKGEEQVDIDFQIERKILMQKNALLKEMEQANTKINAIMKDMAIQVQDQGNNIDVISQELLVANRNMHETNDQLEEARYLQKKSKRKYILLVIIIIIIAAGAGGIIYILKH